VIPGGARPATQPLADAAELERRRERRRVHLVRELGTYKGICYMSGLDCLICASFWPLLEPFFT